MEPFIIFETDHWAVSHRADSRYPGYLIVASRGGRADLHELGADALSGLGPALRDTEELLRSAFSPLRVIFAKLGFSAGLDCHFHAVPVSVGLLAEIAVHQDYTNEPDGNDVLLFVNRIYCERAMDPTERDRLTATVATLRKIRSSTSSIQP